MLRPFTLALLALPLCAVSARAEPSLVTAMPPGEEACYGRVYDSAHLAGNPRQTIVEFFLARLHTPDPEREDEPVARERSIATAVETEAQTTERVRYAMLQVMARLREPRGRFGGLVTCNSSDGATIACGVECDGGGFSARVGASEATIRMREHGVRVGPGCGGFESESIMLGARAADRNLRLARLPVSACLAARTAARPDWVRHGRPLRETLPGRGTACFARSYDAAHLARTPDQQVASIALRATWRPATSEANDGIELSIRAQLRDGSSNVVRAHCYGTDYEYACEGGGMASALRLRRGPNGGVIVRGEPADPANGQAEAPLATLLELPLGRADDVFRLDAANAEACAH